MTQQQTEQPDDVINTGSYGEYWRKWKERFGDDTEAPIVTKAGKDLVLFRMTPEQFHRTNKSWGYLMEEWNGLNEAMKSATPDNPLYPWATYRLERLDAEIDFCEDKMLMSEAR